MARKSKAVAVVEEVAVEAAVFPKTFESGVTIESVASGDAQHARDGGINLTVKFTHIPVEVPFTAHFNDTLDHGVWLYEEALKGIFGEVIPYDRPLPNIKDLQDELDKIWPDVVLGIATEEELSLAKALRIQIKAMS
jgi:hypothetical protein